MDDTTDPAIVCPSDIARNVDPGLSTAVVAYTAPVGTDNCGTATTVQIAGLASGSAFPTGTTTNTFEVTDGAGNTITCSFDVTVVDSEAPVIDCPPDIVQDTDAGACQAVVAYTAPVGTDNAPGAVTVQIAGLAPGSVFPIGTTTNTFEVTDSSGLTATCSFDVTIEDNEAPTASDPSGITVECTGDVPAADTTVVTDGSDNCGTVTVAFVGDSALAGSNPGIITRTYSVTDAAGNVTNVEQAITVDDTTDPAIVCPSDIARNVDPGLSTAVVAYTAPVGTDNCGTATTVQIAGLASGSAFPTGTTTNTFEVTDGAGNTITCSFDVTVVDSEAPVIDCPPDIVQDTDAGACQAVVAYTAPVGTDNAPGAVTVQIAGLAPGSVFPIGTTTNTFEVTDSSGLTATCSFDVTIEDNEAPTASDPSGITVECTGDVPAADTTVVTDGSDNCGTVTVAFVGDSALAGSNPGIITRTYSVTDAAGNSINVEQAITVDDTTAPTGSAPPDVTVECSANIPAVDIAALTGVTDNCSPLSNIVMAHVGDVSDGNFNPETITRTYSITDEAGNGVNVDQTIIVQAVNPDIIIGDASAIEGENISFPITLSQAKCDEDLTLTFTFMDGTAESSDYINTNVQVIIPAGDISANVIVPTIDDTIDEVDEDFTIRLGTVDFGTVGDISDTAIGTILDNDSTPVDIDSDDDGIIDSFEDLNSDGDNDPTTDPTDTDSDGIPDYLDIDSDNDGIPDNIEAQTTTGYIAPSSIDINNNGLDDAYENSGNLGLIPEDSEGDGIPDYVDDDSDEDGVPDSIEGNDLNQDGIPDVELIGSDKDNDGLDDGYEGSTVIDIDVNDEISSPGSDLLDTDFDGVPNYRDSDDDDDGIETIDEDLNLDGNYANDDSNGDGLPNYLDPDIRPNTADEEEVDVINVITPNGDGIHDFLTIQNIENYPNNTVKIFNRWGVEVYATKSYNTTGNVFDGTSEGRVTLNKDNKLPVGTYFYILEYEDLTGNMKELSGYLYINR